MTTQGSTPTGIVPGLGLVGAVVAFGVLSVPSPPPAQPAEQEPTGLTLEHWELDPSAERGRAVYEQYCIGCHGPEGRGDGEAASWLDPLPRNFQSGNFKFRTTPSGELPLLSDIEHVVRCGLEGSAMRRFPLLPSQDVTDVARYVQSLVEFGLVAKEVRWLIEDDDMTIDEIVADELDELREQTVADAYEYVWPLNVEERAEVTEEGLEQGRELYEAQCLACHGASGRGEGGSADALRDYKDAEIRPRDFTSGVFRAGSEPRDVFIRLKSGLNGTPMPAVYGTDEELWHLTHYILSLVTEDGGVVPHPTSCAHGSTEGASR